MKQVCKSEIEMGKYYVIYFNNVRHEVIIATPSYIEDVDDDADDDEYFEITWIPIFGLSTETYNGNIEVFDAVKGMASKGRYPLEVPFDNEDSDEFFELDHDELLNHVVVYEV